MSIFDPKLTKNSVDSSIEGLLTSAILNGVFEGLNYVDPQVSIERIRGLFIRQSPVCFPSRR